MKNGFPGYFAESTESQDAIWQTALFVFDTSVILDLYRYSESSRKELISLLRQHKERCWIPHQVAQEYLAGRPSTVREHVERYDSSIRDIENISNSLANEYKHPFISSEAKEQLDKAIHQVSEELTAAKDEQCNLINNDFIKEEIANIFEDRVGVEFSASELNDVIKDGEARYNERTPPGYMDRGKIKNPQSIAEKMQVFGDWLLWKQLLDHATATSSSVIFVTSEKKEDWWATEIGRTIGPRPELVKEFTNKTKQRILFYRPIRFVQASKTFLDTKPSASLLKELDDFRKNAKSNEDQPTPNFVYPGHLRELSVTDHLRLMAERDSESRSPIWPKIRNFTPYDEEKSFVHNKIKTSGTFAKQISKLAKEADDLMTLIGDCKEAMNGLGSDDEMREHFQRMHEDLEEQLNDVRHKILDLRLRSNS